MVFTTLAVGQQYEQLAKDLCCRLVGAGHEVVALTSTSSALPDTVIDVQCPDDGTPIWHWKRHAIREGLRRSDKVVFIDADYQPTPGTALAPLQNPPKGFSSADRVSPIGGLWFDKHFLDMASKEFGINWREVSWWGCSLWAITDDGHGLGQRFVDAWDRLAYWARDTFSREDANSVRALSDCAAMAFAASIAGPKATLSGRSRFFEPITAAFRHLRVRGWEQAPNPSRVP